MTKDQALQMAIEALELINEHAFRCGLGQDAIKACKEALERPSNMVVVPLDKLQDMQRRIKALAQPQKQWVGLSDADKKKIHKEHHLYIPTIALIEAKLKELNT